MNSTPGGLQVFAVEDRAVQLTWASLPRSEVTLEVGDHEVVVGDHPPMWYRRTAARRLSNGNAGPGALFVGGLDPGTAYEVMMSAPRLPRRPVAMARTLPLGPGRLLGRFATISDCHIGESHFGLLRGLREPRVLPDGLEPYPVRCTKAAIAEAEAWGAELIVAKGDVTQRGNAADTESAIEVLRSATVPVVAVLGNHDIQGRVNVAARFTDAGFPTALQPKRVELGAARLLLAHSPIRHKHGGRFDETHLEELATMAGAAPGPVIVAVHHPLRRLPVETHYPPSLRWRDTVRTAAALTEANPSVLLIAGHTHRNRRYRVRGVTVAEVGSTKDYPGQWAGYAVYEGGVRQVVRRIASPSAIAWTEMSGRALGGQWRRWSPGRLADRCWILEWPSRVIEGS